METSILEALRIIRFVEMENIFGQMALFILDSD
jgi:hypothetical protein